MAKESPVMILDSLAAEQSYYLEYLSRLSKTRVGTPEFEAVLQMMVEDPRTMEFSEAAEKVQTEHTWVKTTFRKAVRLAREREVKVAESHYTDNPLYGAF